MYELFTGRRLFEATTLDELTAHQAALPSRVPPDLQAVSPRLREVVLQCLDRDPARRPESVEAVARRLQVELLDAEARERRMLQVIAQASFLPLVILGSLLVGLGEPRPRATSSRSRTPRESSSSARCMTSRRRRRFAADLGTDIAMAIVRIATL
jgi:serine/threonine-protein kinase